MSALCARMFLRSFLLQSGFSDEGRQTLGFAWALDPALRAAYGSDAPGLAAARARHLGPFNTNPCAAGIILGTTAALESRAAGTPSLAERVLALKSAAGASLAGAADALFWGSLRPLAASLAVFTAAVFHHLRLPHSLFWGAFAGLAVFNVPALAARWVGLSKGLAEADASLLSVARFPVQTWIRRGRLAAIFLLIAASALVGSSGSVASPLFAACAFAAGVILSRVVGGPLRLVAASGLLGVAAAAGGWTP